MIRGIAIFGANGGGKSTLTHALAKQTGYFEMDVEDYYFPEQQKSRKSVLENDTVVDTEYLGELPYSKPRTKNEVQEAILQDVKTHPKFILAGVTMNWCDEIMDCIDIAFWVQTPLEKRLARIQAREEKRFGARVLEGGDMFEQQKSFREVVQNRDPKVVEECAVKFKCPVVVLDGTLPVQENVEKILVRLKVTIEKATMQDLDAVEALYNDVCDYLADKEYNPGWRKGGFPARENALCFIEPGAMYVAKVDEKVVGSISLTFNPSAEIDEQSPDVEITQKDIMYIHIFTVHPGYQRYGIGSQLLDFAQKFAGNAGAKALQLYVWEKNSVAIKAYEKKGFVCIGKDDIGLSEYGLDWFCLYEKEIR